MRVPAVFTCRITMPADESQESARTPLGPLPEPEREFDESLGKAMGEAARRLQAGEITEAEFYEQFHEDVVAEFGADDRPIDAPEEDR
jgi:molybdopterin-containing oxidoreductase family iron-sulfur binding subunit